MNTLIRRLILIALLFASYTVAAQTKAGTASGRALNAKDKTPIEYASVAVKKLFGDSSVAGVGTTSQTGTFSITNLPVGKYRLFIAYLGLKSVNKDFELTATTPGINFGDLNMEDTGVDLKAVEVKGEIPPVKVKKDTLEFNAAAFKVKENAVVEDVLKKLPGVDVAKDGTITAQGETIKKVRVDGKDFMGSDPLLATRNLPADMIDKIQIIDDMSDQSKFSGIDDGNREKIINITTRQDKKNGFFGNSSLGYGQDSDRKDRYDANINVNKFKNDEQMSVIGQFNNVNKQNFGGGGGGGGGRGGMNFGGGPVKGITTTNMIGLNYADVYKGGTQFNVSYNFNKTSKFNEQQSYSQNIFGNTTTTYNQKLNSTAEGLNHRFNMTLDTKLDSTISLRLQPNISLSKNTGLSNTDYDRSILNTRTIGTQEYKSNSSTPSISNNLLLRKKFQRRGRTLSLNVNTNINNSEADNYNRIDENITIGTTPSIRLTNQLNDQNAKSISNTAKLAYTEPLSKTLSLELNYTNGYGFDNQERIVYNFNPVTLQYDIRDPFYSNSFENTTFTNTVGFVFNKNEKKYNWNIGLGVQNQDQQRLNVSDGTSFDRNYTNLTPQAQFRYNFSTSKRLNIRYNGRTQQPSISQIQPIRDPSNTQTVPIGNPDLKPSFSNTLFASYNSFDFASFRSMFIGTFITQQLNAFSTQSVLVRNPSDDDYGKTKQTSVNVDGNFNASVFGNVSQPIIKGNKLTLQIDLRGSYAKSTGFTDNGTSSTLLKNITQNYSVMNGYKLVSNLNKLDLIAGISGTMFRDTYSVNVVNNQRYYTLAPNIDISYLLPGNIRIQSDLTYNKLTGRGAANVDYKVVNAYISRQFFKNRGTFKVSVNDLLNENTGVERTGTGNSIQDLTYNVLKRYYMFTFTYSLNKVAGKVMGAPQPGQGGQRMMMHGMGM